MKKGTNNLGSLCVPQRREFITGDVEPTDAESEWHSENEEEDKLAVSGVLSVVLGGGGAGESNLHFPVHSLALAP